jgi:hypothetical protein
VNKSVDRFDGSEQVFSNPFPSAKARMNRSMLKRKTARLIATLWSLAAVSISVSVSAQDAADISDSARQQIAQILAVKDSLSPAEQKLASNLAFASRQSRGLPAGPMASLASVRTLNSGMVEVEIKGTVSSKLLSAIAAHSGRVKRQLPKFNYVRASVPLKALHLLAEEPDVLSIREPALRKTNAGAVTTQGYISHRARAVVAGGINGSGVKVGVLSDSASSNSIATLIASGDLRTNTTVLEDIIDGPATDEGTAMMEIIQDIAPGAQLYFASSFNGSSSFADNIHLLALAGCSVIVDSTTYSDEPVFQDGQIAQAVNAFVAGGGLYVSAAGNGGNVRNATSSTWQGDFFNNGAVSAPISTGGETGSVNGFPVPPFFFTYRSYDLLLVNSSAIELSWSDPWGASANDYDLFILNSAGTAVLNSSTTRQNGAGSDPFEECFSNAGFPANARIVIVLHSGSARALNLRNFYNSSSLAPATAGNILGHHGGQGSLTVAASYWDSAHTGTKPFNGTNNPVDTTSADGSRKVFFNPDGSPITPGNLLFATGGGTNLQKPELTAADGVACQTPGFHSFIGTSAAAAHVAGIAALVKSAKPSLTGAQIRQILINTATDNMDPGPDINGGYGVVNAQAAVQAALAP